MEFLCHLMVHGSPTFEKFEDAHRDLGGKVDYTSNGQVEFSFARHITFKKTLHVPHASSGFSHRLARIFYRNCGLHPYFFVVLDDKIKI